MGEQLSGSGSPEGCSLEELACSDFVSIQKLADVLANCFGHSGLDKIIAAALVRIACGSASSAESSVTYSSELTQVDAVAENPTDTEYTIPAGTIEYSILVESGTAEVNGALRQPTYSLSQPPVPGGVYPEIAITNIAGRVHVTYVTA